MEELRFEPVQYSRDDIGPNLLESITKGLYVNPLHIIREYVMNGIEASPPAEQVKVQIQGKDIFIWDNGGGMNKAELDNARKIGFPLKDPKESFGFRGQGIWSGVSVCDAVIISTKRQDSDKRFWLRIDAKGLRDELEKRTDKPLAQLLSDHVKIAEMPAPPKEHHTLVHLVNVASEVQDQLLSVDRVRDYMRRILPADFDRHFPYRKQVNELLSRHVTGYRPVTLYLNNELIERPPCIDDLEAPISDVLRNERGKPIAFWWACLHKESRAIEQAESAGLVYKKWGVTVGDQKSCLEWWKRSQHLLYWCTGEIHVIDHEATLDSEKTNFEGSPAKTRLMQKCGDIWLRFDEETRKKSFIERLKTDLDTVSELPKISIFDTAEQKTERIRQVANLTKSLSSRKKSKYSDARMKKSIDRALETSKQFARQYLRTPTREEETREEQPVSIQLQPQPSQQTKPYARVVIEAKPEVLPVYSLADAVDDLQLSSQTDQAIEIVEQVLDGYFVGEPHVRDELKRRIAEQLRRILGK